MSHTGTLHALARRVAPAPLRRAYWAAHAARERRRILAGRAHEPDLCAAVLRHVRPGWTCLDIGANCGLVAVPMAHAAGPTGRVIAFDPVVDNTRRLADNARACGVADRITIVQAAVADRSAPAVPLYPGRRASNAEWNITGADADGAPRAAVAAVPCVSIDDHLPPDAVVHLAKIDVEGAESLVLAGMTRTLDRCRPVLVIECHSPANWAACEALRGRGYDLTTLAGDPIRPGAPMVSHLVATAALAARRAA